MAYDDVLAKLLCTLEVGTLAAKLGSNEISDRFRASSPFSDKSMRLAHDSVTFLLESLVAAPIKPRFNKATLFTWLVFVTYFARSEETPTRISSFIYDFEQQRGRSPQSIAGFRQEQFSKLTPLTERSLLRIFSDRSSSRVSDVASVILRDLIAWIFFYDFNGHEVAELLSDQKAKALKKIYGDLLERKQESTEETLEQSVDHSLWGTLT
jgi:hypothetical protein